MRTRSRFVGLVSGCLLAAGPMLAEGLQDVSVVNFPPVQKVDGQVAVTNPLRLATDHWRAKYTVLPSRPDQVRDVTDGGRLATNGYGRVRISLAGVATSRVVAPGTVGVLLVPDDPDISELWQESGIAQLSQRVEAQVRPNERGIFEAAPIDVLPAFSSYRMYLYNTLGSSVELRIHAYFLPL
jgi:hypothetical protein